MAKKSKQKKVGKLGKGLKKAASLPEEFVNVPERKGGVSLLMHETRRGIFQYVCRHPCAYLSAISRDLNTSAATASWHLKKLTQNELIAKKKVGALSIFYPMDMLRPRDIELLTLLNYEGMKEIFSTIARSPGITQKEIANLLHVSYRTIMMQAAKLEKEDVIVSVKDGKYKRYYPTNLIKEMEESYRKWQRHFKEHILKILKNDCLTPKVVLSTDKEIIIQITPGREDAVLKLYTSPFYALLG